MSENQSQTTLWTRDFTIITAGSVVSMFGNAMSGFAMSLMVLDLSESTFLYSIYISMFTLPQLIMPVFSGSQRPSPMYRMKRRGALTAQWHQPVRGTSIRKGVWCLYLCPDCSIDIY